MIRLLHLLPITLIIASVTATLRAEEMAAFGREFLKAAVSLAVGFVGLGIVVFVVSILL